MAVSKIIPRGFVNLADYLNDIVSTARRSETGSVMPAIQWSARNWDPTAQELSSYGPEAGRVLGLFDYLENAPRQALLIGESTPVRQVKNPRKISITERGTGLYIPGGASRAYTNIASGQDTLAAQAAKSAFRQIPDAGREERVFQVQNAQELAKNILQDRLGPKAASYKSMLAALGESLGGDIEPLDYTYQVLTTPMETGLRAAQASQRLGPDFLDAISYIAAKNPSSATPARVLKLSEASGLNRDVVDRAINNIVGRGDDVRGVTIQDEIFRLLGREDLNPVYGDTSGMSLGKAVSKADKDRTVAAAAKAKDKIASAATMGSAANNPAARRLNQLLDQLLTPAEKAGLEYLTPEQYGEFIQTVLRERAPGWGA